MKNCKVINRPLTVDGRTFAPGAALSFADEDAALLIARGRLADAGDGKPAPEPVTEQELAAVPDQDQEPEAAAEEPEQKTDGSE